MSRAECPSANSSCKYFASPEGCFSDLHHQYFPRAEYKAPLEKRFRELDENKVQLCRQVHDDIHADWEIPDKPSLDVMREAIAVEKLNRGIVYGNSGV